MIDAAPPRIYFHHIPKTAGTSLRDYLVAQLGEHNVAPALRSGRMRDALREYARFAAITGHLDVDFGDRLPDDRITVTLLREPIDRVASAFYFERHAYHAGRRAAEAHGDLDAWLASLDAASALSLNAHLCALWPLAWESPKVPTIDERVAAAKRALDAFDVVGLQSSMAESLVLLAARSGLVPPDETPHANRTPGRPPLREIPAPALRRLEAMLAPDIEIHVHALRLFQGRRLRLLREAALRAHRSTPETQRAIADETANGAARHDPPERPKASMNRPVRIEAVTIRGEVSEANYLQVGERVVIALRITSTISVDDLNVGFAIRDATDALVFASNTLSLGERLSVAPGAYDVRFRFPNALGVGDYRISATLHRGGAPVDGYLHHVDAACEFFVVDRLTEYFEGRVHLHVTADASAIEGQGRVEIAALETSGHERFALLAHRHAALAQFSARLEPLADVPPLHRAADAMLHVDVTNTGDTDWGAFGKRAVAFSYHWLDEERRPIVFDGLRTSLPHDVAAGERVRVGCFVRAPEQPGRMTLVMTLVQEEVAWFNDREPASAVERVVDVI
ncbi:MAG TPA: Wzt carbohydrate-binding domain-containing protein [Casimicrobiaceae bacterium]